jgi:hypothetical protein
MTHDVFISHSTLDKLPADAVCHGLEAKGIRCWMAPRDQFAGKPYGEQITEAIRSAQVMVLVFSEHVNRSQAVLNEINIAANANVTIVPFRIASVEFNPELHYYLGRTHWLDAFPQPVDAYIDALASTVQRNLPRQADPAPPTPQTSPSDKPAAAPHSAPAAHPAPQHPAPQHPSAQHRAPRVNYTALIVLGMLFAFILLVVFMTRKPSPAQEHAASVVAQAVANAIQSGQAEDRQPSNAPATPATPKPSQDVPY